MDTVKVSTPSECPGALGQLGIPHARLFVLSSRGHLPSLELPTIQNVHTSLEEIKDELFYLNPLLWKQLPFDAHFCENHAQWISIVVWLILQFKLLLESLLILIPIWLSSLVIYTKSINPVQNVGVLFEHRILKVRKEPWNHASRMWMCTHKCACLHHHSISTHTHSSRTSLHTPSKLNLPPINQKHNFTRTGKISFGPHMTREPVSFPVKTPSNAARLPDSAACRNQIQSEITANHLSQ